MQRVAAKEVVRSIYDIDDAEFVTQFGIDLLDDSCPPEVRRFGITMWTICRIRYLLNAGKPNENGTSTCPIALPYE